MNLMRAARGNSLLDKCRHCPHSAHSFVGMNSSLRPVTSVREIVRDSAKALRTIDAREDHVGSYRRENSRNTVPGFSSFLTDTFGRQHNYLRISLTERCNLRCLYCMPAEGIQLAPPSQNLTTAEIVYLSELFVREGVTKIRLTGGEPTVRKDITSLMVQIGNLRKIGLRELCLTTNGVALNRKLESMIDSGLTGVNLSLDSLDPFQYALMTRSTPETLKVVRSTIDNILQLNKAGAGIKLKINCVVMRGLNDREILSFVALTKDHDIEVRFIEYMPFDGNRWSLGKMMTYREMLDLIRAKYPDVQRLAHERNETSKTFHIPDFAGRLGFITSMTHNFCGSCNRLRITSDGNLKVCLFGQDEVSLRDLLRRHNDQQPLNQMAIDRVKSMYGSCGPNTYNGGDLHNELLTTIGAAVKRKRKEHAGLGDLQKMKNRPMIRIGG